MKVLVTGGAGFIGSNLVRLLTRERHDVCVLDRLTYAGHRSSLADVPTVRLVEGDVADESTVSSVFQDFQPDWIMHLAAESHVDRSIDGPGEFIHTNVLGTYVLLEAARKYLGSKKTRDASNRFRFLHVSTDEVYGSLGSEGLFSESSPYDPHSPYAASKASSDHLVRAWHCTYALPTLVTNSGNNFGPFQHPEKLVPMVILKCLRREPIPVYGDGSQSRHWIHVNDHCEALYQVMLKGTIGQTYNIAGSSESSNLSLVKSICFLLDRELGREGEDSCQRLIRFVTDRPGHDYRYALDISKIRSEIGWIPKTTLLDGLTQTLRWYLSNEQWWSEIVSSTDALRRRGLTDDLDRGTG